MKLPRHIAIIMDGNGRWATSRGLPRVAGHKAGVESVRTAIKVCAEKKIEALTLFAFSTENWNRPKDEVGFLMGHLISGVLNEEIKVLYKNGIRLKVIGEIERLEASLQKKILEATELTSSNKGLILTIALSYSGRWDITNAVKNICKDVEDGKIKAKDISDQEVGKYICLHDLPEVDLLVRTSGEQRISNFMLWQLAYSELYFTEVLWPDFREKDILDALVAYNNRDRRFGIC